MKPKCEAWSGRVLVACVVLAAVLAETVVAQANIPDGSANGFTVPGTPSTMPQVFTPMRAVPTFNPPPGGAPNAFYEPRVSGVFGFVDPANPGGGGPAYDMEYYLIGRGDGLLLIEATPDPINGPAKVTASDLAANGANLRGDFIANPLATPAYPTPPFTAAFSHPASATYTPWSECAVLRDPASGTFYAYGTMGGPGLFPGIWVVPLLRTTAGGASVLRFNAAAASWWSPQATPANAANPVFIPNVHNITVDQASGLIFLCSNGYLIPGTNPAWRHPYAEAFFVLSTQALASFAQPAIRYVYYYGSGLNNSTPGSTDFTALPHDAYVKDGKVLVSNYGSLPFAGMGGNYIGCVDEYQISDFLAAPALPVDAGPAHRKRYFAPLADISWNAVGLHNPHGLDSVHSTYKTGSTLWMLSEIYAYQIGWLQAPLADRGRVNIQAVDLNRDLATGLTPTSNVYQPLMATGRPTVANPTPRLTWESQQASLGGLITLLAAGSVAHPPDVFRYIDPIYGPVNHSGVNLFAIVHQMRGNYQTAIQAHYVDGIDLVDLSDPALGTVVLGSFDTTWNHIQDAWWEPNPQNPGHTLVEDGGFNANYGYRGAYDVWPYHDSGLICVANGIEGAIVLRVDEGHLNRYWRATAFGTGTASAGVFPRLVAENGPPREGHSLILRDSNRNSYTRGGPGNVAYQYTLQVNLAAPANPPTSMNSLGYWENVTPLLSFGPQYDDTFVFPASMVPAHTTPLYIQMVIEEGTLPGSSDSDEFVPHNPRRLAASRGTWFGIAKP